MLLLVGLPSFIVFDSPLGPGVCPTTGVKTSISILDFVAAVRIGLKVCTTEEYVYFNDWLVNCVDTCVSLDEAEGLSSTTAIDEERVVDVLSFCPCSPTAKDEYLLSGDPVVSKALLVESLRNLIVVLLPVGLLVMESVEILLALCTGGVTARPVFRMTVSVGDIASSSLLLGRITVLLA